MDQHEFAKLIETRRQEIIDSQSQSESDQFLKREVELMQALFIWGDFEGWFFLRSDLSVIVHRDSLTNDDVGVVLDEAKRNFVLDLTPK